MLGILKKSNVYTQTPSEFLEVLKKDYYKVNVYYVDHLVMDVYCEKDHMPFNIGSIQIIGNGLVAHIKPIGAKAHNKHNIVSDSNRESFVEIYNNLSNI